MSQCHEKRLLYYPKNPGHSEGLYNQEMSSKVTVMVHHHKPECLVKRLDCCVDASKQHLAIYKVWASSLPTVMNMDS